jgi:hypothetical protein
MWLKYKENANTAKKKPSGTEARENNSEDINIYVSVVN